MNYERVCLELLAQDNFLQINKKLLANLGLEKAVFIAYLIDKYKYLKKEGKLKDDYFYSTDSDILLFSGLKLRTIQNIKKEGEKMGLFSTRKEGIPAKTFYKINFYKINKLLFSEKTIDELSYERLLQSDTSFQDIDHDFLKKLSLNQLRLFCKKNKITYLGNYSKDELIKKILLEKNKERNNTDKLSFSKNEIIEMNFRTLREVCKKLDIKYSGNDNKSELINKLFKFFNLEEVDKIISKKSDNKWTNKLITSEQKSCHNQEQIITTKKQKQIHDHDDEVNSFEVLFKELKVNFTSKNKNSIKNLLAKMTKEEVISYLKETFNNLSNNPNVNNIPALFSEKISKEEKQEPFFEKELSGDKKEWLNRYSGVINNIALKKEVENIILDIPLNILEKERNILGRMSIFDFKNHLYQLRQTINR